MHTTDTSQRAKRNHYFPKVVGALYPDRPDLPVEQRVLERAPRLQPERLDLVVPLLEVWDA